MNHSGDTNKMVGEDHIRDATKMVSDTPMTDEAQFGTGRVSVDFARTLERELNAANERIKRLEEAGNGLLWYFCQKNTGDISFLQSEAIRMWNKAKEAKP